MTDQTYDVADLGSSGADDGTVAWQGSVPVTDDENDAETFGAVPVLQALGVTSLPFPADDDGKAEGVFLRGCGNNDAICVGARDTRSAAIIGNLAPGDTVVHCTHANQSAQVQLKGERRQVVLTTNSADGEQGLLIIDGKNRKFQFVGWGGAFEYSQENGWCMTTGKAFIQIKGDTIILSGKVLLGLTPLAPVTVGPGALANLPSTGSVFA